MTEQKPDETPVGGTPPEATVEIPTETATAASPEQTTEIPAAATATAAPPAPPATPTAAASDASGGGNGRKIAVVAVIALVGVALIGGVAFAWSKLSGGGPQPHDVLPASSVAYARVDLDPSASQKIALLKLIRKFPKAAEEIGVTSADQDVRKLVVDEIAKECDLDYEQDFEPWLGNRAGFSVDAEQTAVFALQVTDEDEAAKAIPSAFVACGGEKPGVAFLEGYAIVAETQAIADKTVKDAQRKPLAEKAAFVEDTDELGDQGVASVWADTKAVETFGDGFIEGFNGSGGGTQLDASTFDGVRSFAATLRADDDSLALESVSHVDEVPDLKASRLGSLPKDTAAALSVAGVGPQVEKAWETFMTEMTASGEDPQPFLDFIASSFGFTLPDDLVTLFGDRLTLAVGSRNLASIPTFAGPADIASVDVGLALQSDQDAATDLAERLAALAAQAGIPLEVSSTDDGAVLATNADAADALAGGGKLGSSSDFERVVPDADQAFAAIFVDLDTILEAVIDSGLAPADEEELRQFTTISAIGASASRASDQVVEASIRVAFTD